MTNADVFAARLARIQQRGPNTMGTIFVGVDEQFDPGAQAAFKTGKASAARNASAGPVPLLLALGLGGAGAALGLVARFHLMPAPQDTNPDLDMALSLGIGLLVSLVLARAVRLRSGAATAMQLIGVLVMVCGFHNLAHWAPQQMSALLSPAWVDQAQATTPPNSARVGASYHALSPLPDAAPRAGSTAELPTDTACTAAAPGVKILQLDNGKPQRANPAEAGCSGT